MLFLAPSWHPVLGIKISLLGNERDSSSMSYSSTPADHRFQKKKYSEYHDGDADTA